MSGLTEKTSPASPPQASPFIWAGFVLLKQESGQQLTMVDGLYGYLPRPGEERILLKVQPLEGGMLAILQAKCGSALESYAAEMCASLATQLKGVVAVVKVPFVEGAWPSERDCFDGLKSYLAERNSPAPESDDLVDSQATDAPGDAPGA